MRLVVRVKPASTPDAVRVTRSAIRISGRPMRVLDFDLENRPLSYLGSDFTTAEVTAIAWSWVGSGHVSVRLLGDYELPEILEEFVEQYEQADLVTGHYITGHDLPMVNGALMEFGLPALSDKPVQDTKVHLMRSKGISLSQESLGAMFRLEAAKVQMNQAKWRAANRLTNAGRAEVKKRVCGDVLQHIELRQRLLEKGYLSPAKIWRSQSSEPLASYTP